MGKSLKPLIPVPKVLVPVVAGAFYLAGRWVATGEFDREEVGTLVMLAGYAAVGWWTPEARP
jgi:hypothetical protein